MAQTEVELFLDGSISTTDIANSAVTTAKIADANITTAKIADGAVSKTKLSSDIVFNYPFTTKGFSIPI